MSSRLRLASPKLLCLSAALLIGLAAIPAQAQSPAFIKAWPITDAYAFGLDVDAGGDIYVSARNAIEKYTNDGQLLMRFNIAARDLAIGPDGNVYVANSIAVFKLSNNGDLLGQWGSEGSADGQFLDASAITVDANGNVFVADQVNHRIQKFTSDGTFLLKWGSMGSGNGQFPDEIYGMAVDSQGNVYVGDVWTFRIQKFTNDGVYIKQWGIDGLPFSLSFDNHDHLYVADMDGGSFREFDTDGVQLDRIGTYGDGPGQLVFPWSVAADPFGNIFVADNHAMIHKFGPLPTSARTRSWGSLKTPAR